jgi:hypothetical protein
MATDDLIRSSSLGFMRGIGVYGALYPLEVIKTLQQAEEISLRADQAAARIFQERGIRGFYAGFTSKLMETGVKQLVTWPILIELMPPLLAPHKLHPLVEQGITGVAVASVNALLSAPFNKKMITSIVQDKRVFSFSQAWSGLATHWMNQSVSWVAFLVSQKFLRDQYQQRVDRKKLTLGELAGIGSTVAIFVSVVTSATDRANTLKQCQRAAFGSSGAFRGVFPRTVMLMAHGAASVALMGSLEHN